MRIISNNIDFDLPTGFAAEFTRNNVMLTDAGEQTAPITLPGTPKNLKLVQNSDRLDNYYKPLTDLTVTVIDGLMNRQCNMGIHTANEVDGISCTLYFDSGDFYSVTYNKKLASLPWVIIKPSLNINNPLYLENNTLDTPENRVKWCINLLKNISDRVGYNSGNFHGYPVPGLFHRTEVFTSFKVFPVLTTQEYKWKYERIISITPGSEVTVQKYDEYGNVLGSWNELGEWIPETETIISAPSTETETQTITHKFMLNGFDTEYIDTLPAIDSSIRITNFQGENEQKVWADSTEITLPLGYGMTPFLTIRFVLENIFSGFTLDTSAISAKNGEYVLFENEVLINTVADAIIQGQINPAQLVPDVTVKDFVAWCEKRYAGKFIVNQVSKSVVFYSYDQLEATPDLDITTYLTDKAKQGAAEFEKITIKYNSDILADTEDSKIKSSIIDFDFFNLVETKINKAFCNTAKTLFYYVDLTLYVIEIGEVINKNSTLVVDGKTVVEKPTTPSEIKIVNFDDYTNSFFLYTLSSPITFFTAVRRLHFMDTIPQYPDIKTFYIPYQSFKLNSNIPLTAEMNIPAPILEQLKLHTPKLLNGQPVMIESIKYALGKKGTQTVTMRTLRPYADR